MLAAVAAEAALLLEVGTLGASSFFFDGTACDVPGGEEELEEKGGQRLTTASDNLKEAKPTTTSPRHVSSLAAAATDPRTAA
jgi:hypothetical protein